MQSTNFSLAERLENVYRSMSLSPHHNTGNVSLLNEMEMSDSEKSLNASRRPFSQIDEDEDVECDNPEIRINNEIPNEVSTFSRHYFEFQSATRQLFANPSKTYKNHQKCQM